MANRHAHKKLRAEARARMRTTGESYQAALAPPRELQRRRATPLVRTSCPSLTSGSAQLSPPSRWTEWR